MLSNLRNLRNFIEYYKTYIENDFKDVKYTQCLERYTKFGKTHKVWKDTQNLANIYIAKSLSYLFLHAIAFTNTYIE